VLALLPLGMLVSRPLDIARRKPLLVTTVVALVAATAALAASNIYTARMWPASYGGTTWKIEAVYRSLFGTIKVIRSEPHNGEPVLRMYFQDGLVQNMVGADNRSLSLYTYALEQLAFSYRPDLRTALVLGVGAGMVPMRLAERGVDVTTVDIDGASLRAAAEIFGFDRNRVRAHQADARTFLRACRGGYDVIVVDLFQGDGTPDYLITRDFFRDLKRCLGNDGVAVFNTFADLDFARSYAHILTTLRSELPYMTLYRPDYGLSKHINSFIVAAGHPLPAPANADLTQVPSRHAGIMRQMLDDPLPLTQQLLESGEIITDASNPVATDLAASQLINRRYVVEALPAAFFVN